MPLTILDILVPVGGLVLALCAIELALAIFRPSPHSIERNMFFEADPYTGYRLKPGGVGFYQSGIPAVANSHGHRDVEITKGKPPGVFRILVLGDSFTVGANVRAEESYPKVLERRLRAIHGPHVQVVNTAVGGWDAFQYAQYFEYYGRSFEPDLVLIGLFVGNDAFDPVTAVDQLPTAMLGRRISPKAAARRFTWLKVLLYNHSHLVRLALTQTPAPFTQIRAHGEDFSDLYLALQRSRLANHRRESPEQHQKARNAMHQVRRVKDLAGDAVPVVVALLPDENQINPALQRLIVDPKDAGLYDFRMPQIMLVKMLEDIGVPSIDVLPAFLADRRSLYMNDAHWVPRGHELAAAFIEAGLAPYLAQADLAR